MAEMDLLQRKQLEQLWVQKNLDDASAKALGKAVASADEDGQWAMQQTENLLATRLPGEGLASFRARTKVLRAQEANGSMEDDDECMLAYERVRPYLDF